MTEIQPVVIYEWHTWDGFVLLNMLPHATRVTAQIGETAADVLDRTGIERGWFAFHTTLTDSRRLPLDRPRLCEELRARGIKVINGAATDISKRRVQQTCIDLGLNSVLASRDGDPDETLIVKTNSNFGAEPESHLTPEQRALLSLKEHSSSLFGYQNYQVLPRKSVAPEFWDAPDLTIERYISNAGDIFYRTYLCRNRLVISRVVDPALFKKMPPGIPRISWFVDLTRNQIVAGPTDLPLPAEIARAVPVFAGAFGADFCALDVVQDDAGRCYIIDANVTPWWGPTGHSDLIAFLATGLNHEPSVCDRSALQLGASGRFSLSI